MLTACYYVVYFIVCTDKKRDAETINPYLLPTDIKTNFNNKISLTDEILLLSNKIKIYLHIFIFIFLEDSKKKSVVITCLNVSFMLYIM